MLIADCPDDQKPRLIGGSSGDFEQHVVEPEQLGLNEINSVFGLVGLAFFGIEFKLQWLPPAVMVYILCFFYTKNNLLGVFPDIFLGQAIAMAAEVQPNSPDIEFS